MYFALTIQLAEEAADLAQALLHDEGALGWEVREQGLLPAAGQAQPSDGQVILVAYFEGDDQMKAAQRRLAAELADAEIHAEAVKPEDWSASWRQHVRAVRAGRVWVGPAWLRGQAGEAPVIITIDPGMAFGTGDHPTTLMCLAAIDDFMARHPAASVLDVGTGTGVLAIAARKLGASEVVAIDNDPVAIRVASANAAVNGADVTINGTPLAELKGKFDAVVANVLAGALVELAPAVVARTKPSGEIYLSGLLVHQVDEVALAYGRLGWVPQRQETAGEWSLVSLARIS